MKQKVLYQYRSQCRPVHNGPKRFGSIPSPHPLDATAKKIIMTIYIKSTILRLEKTINILETVC